MEASETETIKKYQYHLDEEGSIVDQYGGLIYESASISDLTQAQKLRLAEIHSEDETIDWETAWELIQSEELEELYLPKAF